MIHGDPDEHRNFLFGSLFYLHRWYAITDNESYAHIQPFIEQMIDRMYSIYREFYSEGIIRILLINLGLLSLILVFNWMFFENVTIWIKKSKEN